MLIPESLRDIAKTVSATIGALSTYTTILVSVLDDSQITIEEYGVLAVGLGTLIATVAAVYKTENRTPRV